MRTLLTSQLACGLVGVLAVHFLPVRAHAAGYFVPVHAGPNLIANQLNNGNNTLNDVLTNGVPDFSRVFKWDAAAQQYENPSFYMAAGGWQPNRSLAPGEGAFFSLIFTSITQLTFTGTRRSTAAPYPLVTGYQIVSHQFPDAATYCDTGLPLVPGARVLQWTNQFAPDGVPSPQSPGWKTSVFTNGTWQPDEPEFAVGEAFFLYLPGTVGPACAARLKGLVKAVSVAGTGAGPLPGVAVQIAGQGSTLTDANGLYSFPSVNPGTLTVTATKAGYRAQSEMVNVAVGQGQRLNFEMIPDAGSDTPVAYNFRSDKGRFFISGTPGGVNFSVDVVWNGGASNATLRGAGQSLPATLVDLGAGRARVTVTLAAVPAVMECSELTADVVNSQGKQRTQRLGAFFDKPPSLVGDWFADSIPWQSLPPKFEWDYSTNWTVISNRFANIYTVEAILGAFAALKLDPFAGTFDGKLGASARLKQKLNLDGVVLTGDAKLTAKGALDVRLRGCNQLEIIPGWSVILEGKAGLKAPLVTVVPALFPPAQPIVTGARKVPVLGKVIDATKFEIYVIVGGSLAGRYDNLQGGDCFLGATNLDASATLGLEVAALIDGGSASARIYGRGTVQPMFDLCPEFELRSTTLTGTIGVEAKAWVFEYKKSVTWTLTLGGQGGGASPIWFLPAGEEPHLEWQPIGTSYLIWGEASRLIPMPADETLVENVTGVAAPALFADAGETLLLYSRNDTNKPWHAANDIARVRRTGGGPFSAGLVTDDLASEFNPRMSGDAGAILAVWERISGDISGATNPVQIPPQLDIVAAWYDRASATWGAPAALTANSVVDHDPLPVAFGATRGVVWIQNSADASIGHALSGDRLLYSAWTGTAWSAPQILWNAPKGILGASFTADFFGEGHAVFAVDDDGDLNTQSDRELYRVSTSSGAWQPAVRLTVDAVEDALPALVAPNGVPRCVWSAGGTLVHSSLSFWNPQPLYPHAALADEAAALAAVTLPGRAAIAYAAGTADGSDAFASFYEASVDRWSLPRRLTHDEHVERSLSLAFDGAAVLLSYLKQATLRTNDNRPEPGRTDIGLLRYALGQDLAVISNSLALDPPNPAPGSSAIIRAVIENAGDLPVQSAQVIFYDGHPQSGGIPIGSPQPLPPVFIAGATQEVSVSWTVPGAQNPHNIYVVADPAGAVNDRDRFNNTNSTRTVLPDLTIETCSSYEIRQTVVNLTARAANTGVLPSAACAISWRLGAIDGEEVGRTPLDGLSVGPADEVSFLWDYEDRHFTDEFVTVYAVADGTNAVEEFDESNNHCAQSVRVIPPWVPRVLSIEILPGGNRKLTFTASHFVAAELAVESADSLEAPIGWSAETGVTITGLGSGVFAVEIPPRGAIAFYRIRVSP